MINIARQKSLNETLSERIFRELKNDILSGFYSPGERLLYEKVSERLGVSMTPLKDALLKLEQEGLVKNIARRGTFVTQLSKRDIIEYCQIRMSLESLAIDLICSQNLVKESDLKVLEKINDQISKAVKKKDPKECIISDMQFHLKIVEMSKNSRLIELLNQFPLSNFLVFMGRGDKTIENGDIILEDHEKIIKALEERDSETIKQVLEKNIFLPIHQIFMEEDLVDSQIEIPS